MIARDPKTGEMREYRVLPGCNGDEVREVVSSGKLFAPVDRCPKCDQIANAVHACEPAACENFTGGKP